MRILKMMQTMIRRILNAKKRVLTPRLERESLVETRLFLELLELKSAFKNSSKDDLNDDEDNDA